MSTITRRKPVTDNTRRSFGTTDTLPSGRIRARYVDPNGVRRQAPRTFATLQDARAWLSIQQADIMREVWVAPKQKTAGRTFGPFATEWVERRLTSNGEPLKPRTKEQYRRLLAGHLAPFADMPIRDITDDVVNDWHAKLETGPVMRAHAYGLLRTILTAAQNAKLITVNPCRIRGASSSKRRHEVRMATLAELDVIVRLMPPEFRMMILLAAWCAPRFGELIGLRRYDVDPDGSAIHIRRGVSRIKGEMVVGTPKTAAGKRTIAVPPHLRVALVEHVEKYAQPGPEGLLFPSPNGGYLYRNALFNYYGPARKAAGREDLRFHDLRHTGAVMAALTGATLKELMSRLGHTTPHTAMIYQHVASGRDDAIAVALSKMVEQPVVEKVKKAKKIKDKGRSDVQI